MRVRRLNRQRPRRGAALLEAAIVLPIVFMFIMAMVVMGLGIFRYQQVAELAREGARYASVHGTQYASDTGNAAATAADVYNNAIKPQAVGLDLNAITYSVSWNTSNSPTRANPSSTPPGAPIANTVSVTVTYTWTPYLYKVGSLGLTSESTSTMPMSY
jgi:Flp pilus assembly protein TadG